MPPVVFQGLSAELVNASAFTSGDLLSNPAEATSETDPRGYSPLAADPRYGWQGAWLRAWLRGGACSEQRAEEGRGWARVG